MRDSMPLFIPQSKIALREVSIAFGNRLSHIRVTLVYLDDDPLQHVFIGSRHDCGNIHLTGAHGLMRFVLDQGSVLHMQQRQLVPILFHLLYTV